MKRSRRPKGAEATSASPTGKSTNPSADGCTVAATHGEAEEDEEGGGRGGRMRRFRQATPGWSGGIGGGLKAVVQMVFCPFRPVNFDLFSTSR